MGSHTSGSSMSLRMLSYDTRAFCSAAITKVQRDREQLKLRQDRLFVKKTAPCFAESTGIHIEKSAEMWYDLLKPIGTFGGDKI